jgi:predicted MPP superfamily phosphohydrolase
MCVAGPLLIEGLPNAFEGFRIVLVTDLHLHPFTTTKLIRRTAESSKALKPDLIGLHALSRNPRGAHQSGHDTVAHD